MLKSVAFMTINNSHDREILHELSICVVALFTKQTLSVAIESWSWISSSRSDIESLMVEEMIYAWQMTVDMKLGMFQVNAAEPNPLAPGEKDVLKPSPPDTDAHRIWINYFQERLDTAKYNNELEIELFVNLMHKSLAFSIENRDFCINRHVSVAGLRFRFLVMGLSILQFGSIINSTSKLILRERIYYAALDYFTTNPRTPTQSFTELRDDIKFIMEFWNKIVAERKYIKDEITDLTSDCVSINGVESSIVGASQSFSNHQSQVNSSSTVISQNSLLTANLGAPLLTTAGFLIEAATPVTTMPRNESASFRNTTGHTWSNTLASTKRSTNGTFALNGSRLTVDSSQYQRYFKDNWKKRNLIMILLSHELDRLYTFFNPFNSPTLMFDRIDVAINHLKLATSDKQWTENVRIAWSVSPTLAVFLPVRFTLDAVKNEVQSLVKSNPDAVLHNPQACQYLATEENILNDSIELNSLLIWFKIPALVALSYFAKSNKGQSLAHVITAQFACKCLMTSKPEALINYIPQLVQALRYDDFGYVREVIFWLAKHSQLLAHQLIWNMMTNVYRDQDGKVKDTQIGDLLQGLIDDIKNSLTGTEKEFFRREFDFFSEITNVSALIKDKPLGDERKKACEIALKGVKLVSNCYLPSNPEAIVLQIIDGRPMQSAAKAPYLARFKVQRVRLSELERLGKTGGKIEVSQALQYECACIFKVGDDVRQDMLALQIMQICKNVFQQEGLELFLFPYRVVATKPGCGVIECVPNSNSRDEIGRQTAVDLYQYFIDKYGAPDTSEFQQARRNFIMSMAGYSLFMFLVQIKDRHNGNLMLDKDGHIIHIDFGFMIESSPGGNIGFEPDMKITTEMGLIMGRDLNSQSFMWFTELCIKGYLAIRPYREHICTLVALMLDTGLPCFRYRAVESLRQRFSPTSNERDAAIYIQSIVNKCYNNWRTNAYDSIQEKQNKIYK
jgi:phosphatidylinositol 4-kinase